MWRSISGFQFTRPRGARRANRSQNQCAGGFQFTRPRGARRLQGVLPRSLYRFNSRARVGRDAVFCDSTGKVLEFQFTRPRGARRLSSRAAHCPWCFNSRARVGRDVDGYLLRIVLPVSIHAPAWGATALSGPNGNQWITYAFPRSY